MEESEQNSYFTRDYEVVLGNQWSDSFNPVFWDLISFGR